MPSNRYLNQPRLEDDEDKCLFHLEQAVKRGDMCLRRIKLSKECEGGKDWVYECAQMAAHHAREHKKYECLIDWPV